MTTLLTKHVGFQRIVQCLIGAIFLVIYTFVLLQIFRVPVLDDDPSSENHTSLLRPPPAVFALRKLKETKTQTQAEQKWLFPNKRAAAEEDAHTQAQASPTSYLKPAPMQTQNRNYIISRKTIKEIHNEQSEDELRKHIPLPAISEYAKANGLISPWNEVLFMSADKKVDAEAGSEQESPLQSPARHSWDLKRLEFFNITVPRMRQMCDHTYWNAWMTTTDFLIDGTTFMVTGDIHDMWIRDSVEQIWPYLPLISKSQFVNDVVYGVILKQAQYIIAEPWANAYKKENYCYHAATHSLTKYTSNHIATRDHELDSGCFFIKLVYHYHRVASQLRAQQQQNSPGGGTVHYHEILDNARVQRALTALFNLWMIEQRHNERSTWIHHRGWSAPKSRDYTGMIWVGNRPSDDGCQYNYHIPDNFFLHQALEYVVYFARLWQNDTLVAFAQQLQTEIYAGIHTYGVHRDFSKNNIHFGDIYCYETNGLGDCLVMDDANLPSLLSLPIITNKYNASIYENTRRYLLSAQNPYFFEGKQAKGIGSPHTPRQRVWPLSLVTEGFTDRDVNKRYAILKMLIDNTGGTNLMHESFDVNNAAQFTRAWFAWANSYFSLYANCFEQFVDFDTEVNQQKIAKKLTNAQTKGLGSLTDLVNSDDELKTWAQLPQRITWIEACNSGQVSIQGDCVGRHCPGTGASLVG